jgi:hypothetical protein
VIWGFIDNHNSGAHNGNMDSTGIGILLMLLSAPALWLIWWRSQLAKVEKAKQWPATEATVQSGAVEVVAQTRSSTVRLPAFAFSYKLEDSITQVGSLLRLMPSGTTNH